jgi:hypothetical protein
MTVIGYRQMEAREWIKVVGAIDTIEFDKLEDHGSQIKVNFSFSAPVPGGLANEVTAERIYNGRDELRGGYGWTPDSVQARLNSVHPADLIEVWYARDDPTLNMLYQPSNVGRFTMGLVNLLLGFVVIAMAIIIALRKL